MLLNLCASLVRLFRFGLLKDIIIIRIHEELRKPIKSKTEPILHRNSELNINLLRTVHTLFCIHCQQQCTEDKIKTRLYQNEDDKIIFLIFVSYLLKIESIIIT